jgi:hypothetical protein
MVAFQKERDTWHGIFLAFQLKKNTAEAAEMISCILVGDAVIRTTREN